MVLPGGLWDGQTRRREFAFGAVTGDFEALLLELSEDAGALPRRVTAVLCGALAHVANAAPTPSLISGLAIGDRQFLMRQLALVLGCDALWLAPACEACQRRFDIQVDQSRLPVKEAGESFPFTTVILGGERVRLRVPTGADQEAAETIANDAEAIRFLARRSVVDPPPDSLGELHDDDIERIDHALEAVAPEVSTVAESECPECGRVNRIYIDPYTCLASSSDALWEEIHELASTYHWSERDILGLSRQRRHTYLQRIAGARPKTMAVR